MCQAVPCVTAAPPLPTAERAQLTSPSAALKSHCACVYYCPMFGAERFLTFCFGTLFQGRTRSGTRASADSV